MEVKTEYGSWFKWDEVAPHLKMKRIDVMRKIWWERDEEPRFREKIKDINFAIYLSDNGNEKNYAADDSGEWTFWDSECFTPYDRDACCSHASQACELITYARPQIVNGAIKTARKRKIKTGRWLLLLIAQMQEATEEGQLTYDDYRAVEEDDEKIRCIARWECENILKGK